jgi:hypothetical protein
MLTEALDQNDSKLDKIPTNFRIRSLKDLIQTGIYLSQTVREELKNALLQVKDENK